MDITRTLAAGAVGLALLVGAAGCGKVAEEAGERIAEKAIEDNSGCTEVDVEGGRDGGSFSGTCDGTEIEADADGADITIPDDSGDIAIGTGDEVGYPEHWPAELKVVEGLDVLVSTSDGTFESAYITGSIDSDLATVTGQVEADLEAAGFTVTEAVDDVEDDGRAGKDYVATRDELEARISVSETPNEPRGSIGVTYVVEPAEA